MKAKDNRRDFLKASALVGGGVLLGQSGALPARAQDGRKTAAPNDTIKTIQNLRTIHGNFTDKEIPDELIESVLQSSIRAANSSNMQTYSIVVVRDRQKMRQVCQYQGSCMLLYCVDFTRLAACAESLGHTYYPDSIVNLITAGINTAFAAQTAVIAARSLGLDCLTTNGIHRGDMERVWTLLDLPKAYCFPLIAVVLGYPTQEPEHRKGRLEGLGVIHRETYHRLSEKEAEQVINTYDDKTRHIGLNEGWVGQGYKHYLDWLFKGWLKRASVPSEAETQMFQLLKRAGFIDQQRTQKGQTK